ncbi:hypothetical protein SDC9_111742 [bioreactor metagenome]|uniref:Uncharacterized protein n=1 Tax=bioreactor metagenome TaxID=1076179 RepID=A0A645BJY4_9ZZZZ
MPSLKNIKEPATTNMGDIWTRTVEADTVVSLSEVIQVAKCNARKKPLAIAYSISLPLIFANSSLCFTNTTGPIINNVNSIL